MDRRKFLKTAGVGSAATAAAATLAAPAYAQGKRKLTMVTSWPRGAAGVWDSVERVVNNVNTASDGSLEIEAKAAGELVGAFEVFDAVSSGQADMYHAADYYFVGQHPAFAFFTAVPFGMTAPEMMAWYYTQGGQELHHELGELFNVKSFLGGNTGAQGGGWYRNPINSAEDYNGLKFRMPGLGGKVVGTLGASVQNIPGGEIYQALSSGALDATEWIGPWSDERLGLQEVAKYYYPAGFHEPGAGLSVVTNLDVWNELTPAQQKAIEVGSLEAHQYTYALYIGNNGPALQRLKDAGVNMGVLGDDVWDAFGAGTEQVMAEFLGDEMFKKVYDSFRAGLAASSDWISQSDSAYAAQRARVLGL